MTAWLSPYREQKHHEGMALIWAEKMKHPDPDVRSYARAEYCRSIEIATALRGGCAHDKNPQTCVDCRYIRQGGR